MELKTKRISGCYIKKEHLELLQERYAKQGKKFKFSIYARQLLWEGLEKKIYGIYMYEPGFSNDFYAQKDEAAFLRFPVRVEEELIEKLSALFEHKWKDDYKTFPIRPYLYWLIRRDITGKTDSVVRLPIDSVVSDSMRRSIAKYIGQQHSVSPAVRKYYMDKISQKYGSDVSFASYVKRLFSEGIAREDFGIGMPPDKNEAWNRKLVYISKELAGELSEVFYDKWKDDFKEFPYCKYLYYLMEKDLMND